MQAAQAGGNLDCLTAKVRVLMRIPGALPFLPLTGRHFRAGGMDVTANQFADQFIERMGAVADGPIGRPGTEDERYEHGRNTDRTAHDGDSGRHTVPAPEREVGLGD